jgi:hypothetical protein
MLLAGLVTVSATTPGTSANQLITQSFLRGEFADSLRNAAVAPLENAADLALSRLREIYVLHAGYSFAPRHTLVSLEQGDTLSLTTGSSFILTSGTAAITISDGAVINITTGREVASGETLTANRRYFGAENAAAVITATSGVTGYVDGFFLTGGDVGDIPAPPPPPPPPGQGLPFNDVNEGDWFFRAIEFVFRNGFFAGTAADTFLPGSPMTRGMFVTVLHRLDGLPATHGGSDFTDVRDPARFYYNAVLWANAHGIVTGVGDGRFAPDAAVTREQMAAIMHRYAQFRGFNMAYAGVMFDGFPDRGDVSDFAGDAMRWAVSWGIMHGSDGRLLPRNTATRAQVAQIIYNFSQVETPGTAQTPDTGQDDDEYYSDGELYDE